jgi:hypothetical protein
MIYAEKILSGHKTWLIRHQPTDNRGVIALILPLLHHVIGEVRIVNCIPFTDVVEFNKHTGEHCLNNRKDQWKLPYNPVTYAWVLTDPVMYPGKRMIELDPVTLYADDTYFIKLSNPGNVVGERDLSRYWPH